MFMTAAKQEMVSTEILLFSAFLSIMLIADTAKQQLKFITVFEQKFTVSSKSNIIAFSTS